MARLQGSETYKDLEWLNDKMRRYKTGLFISVMFLFLTILSYLVSINGSIFLLFPFGLIIVTMGLHNFRNIWYLAIFLMPISVNLADIIPGAALTLPTDLFAAGMMLMVIFKMISERRIILRFYDHPIFLSIVIYFFWMIIASINSHMPLVSWKATTAFLWMFMSFYFLSVLVFHNLRNIVAFFVLLGVGFIITYIIIFTKYMLDGGSLLNLRFNPWPHFNDHTILGGFTSILVPMYGLFAFRGKFTRKFRLFSFTVMMFLIVALFFSYSRGAWVSCLIGIGAIVIFHYRHIVKRFALPAALIFGAVLFFIFGSLSEHKGKNEAVSRKGFSSHIKSITNFKTDFSNAERVNRWQAALAMGNDKPVFGYGPGTYAMLYGNFQYSAYRTPVSTNRGDNGTAHNEYLLAYSEQGLTGMILIAIMFVLPLFLGIRGYLRSSILNIRIIYMGVTAGILIYDIHAFVNNFLDQDKIGVTYFCFLAMITALDIFYLRETGRIGNSKATES